MGPPLGEEYSPGPSPLASFECLHSTCPVVQGGEPWGSVIVRASSDLTPEGGPQQVEGMEADAVQAAMALCGVPTGESITRSRFSEADVPESHSPDRYSSEPDSNEARQTDSMSDDAIFRAAGIHGRRFLRRIFGVSTVMGMSAVVGFILV